MFMNVLRENDCISSNLNIYIRMESNKCEVLKHNKLNLEYCCF